MKRSVVFLSLLLALCLLTAGCAGVEGPQGQPFSEDGLSVHFIDVGQGDAMLITCGDAAMVIDAGVSSQGDTVAEYLAYEGVTRLDYAVGTHPHEDHIGGLDTVIDTVKIAALLLPRTHSETMGLQQVLEAADRQGVKPTYVTPGEIYSLGTAEFEILGPEKEYGEMNNNSIVMKLTYGETSFVLTGDMEYGEAKDILEHGYDLDADVLKIGHHGSANSTPYSFLREIMSEFSVIQVGEDNDYGHPHTELLSRLDDCGTVVLRNDLNGTIVITSDGKDIEISVEKGEIPQPAESVLYIGNVNSKKLHRPECSGLPKEENRVYFDSWEEAERKGYTPCGNCMG